MSPIVFEEVIAKTERWLANHFNLVVCSDECNLTDVIAQHNPQILLFDGFISGINGCFVQVHDTDRHLHIPRAGLVRDHTQSLSFSASYEKFSQLHVTKIFCLGYVTHNNILAQLPIDVVAVTPLLEEKDFTYNNKNRSIPISLFSEPGDASPDSFWARHTQQTLTDTITCLNFSSTKDGKRITFPSGLTEQELSHVMRSSLISVALDSITIPPLSIAMKIAASGSLLVTSPHDALTSLGFVHFKNCLMPPVDEVYTCMKHVLMQRDKLNEIAEAGRTVVRQLYEHSTRCPILDWHLGILTAAPGNVTTSPSPLAALLTRVDEKILESDILFAERILTDRINKTCIIPHVTIRHAIVKLLKKRPQEAIEIITPLINQRLELGMQTPDPIEWALFLICLFVSRNFEPLKALNELHPSLSRTELDTVRWTISLLLDQHNLSAFYQEKLRSSCAQSASLHSHKTHSVTQVLSLLEKIFTDYDMPQIIPFMWEQAQYRGIVDKTASASLKTQQAS
jgi:hypothetical protein